MTPNHTFKEKWCWYLLLTVPWGLSQSHKWEFHARQYPNHRFPTPWIGHGGAQNWPPLSPDLNPLDYHGWGYMKAIAYVQKVKTREELLQRILSAARSISNAAVLRIVTSCLIIRARKCIQADGGHFEQCARVLNSQSVTAHLTTYLNKCTMLLFPFSFIYCTSKTHNSWTVANWTHVCFDSESALELNREVLTLTPGTPVCVCVCVCIKTPICCTIFLICSWMPHCVLTLAVGHLQGDCMFV